LLPEGALGENKRTNCMESKMITEESILIDADLLPLFEKAKNGCLDSQLKLVIAFSDGKGAKKNEALTSELEALIFNNADNYKFKIAALWNPAIREHRKGNFDEMISQFHKVVHFMQEYVPMEKWDFNLFKTMEELIHSPKD
jgi:hypothetical protein